MFSKNVSWVFLVFVYMAVSLIHGGNAKGELGFPKVMRTHPRGLLLPTASRPAKERAYPPPEAYSYSREREDTEDQENEDDLNRDLSYYNQDPSTRDDDSLTWTQGIWETMKSWVIDGITTRLQTMPFGIPTMLILCAVLAVIMMSNIGS